jgi:hypothetical protein
MRLGLPLVSIWLVACGGQGLVLGLQDASVAMDAWTQDLATRDVAPPADAATGPLICHLEQDPLPCTDESVCTPYGSRCNNKRCSCDPAVCQTDAECNDDPTMQSLAGHCNASGSCDCGQNAMWNPQTGKCKVVPCPANAPSDGSMCTLAGEMCGYLPNTTCTCVNDSTGNHWNCAL